MTERYEIRNNLCADLNGKKVSEWQYKLPTRIE